MVLGGGGEAGAPLGSTTSNNRAAVFGFHAFKKAVGAAAMGFGGLISALGHGGGILTGQK